MVIADQTLNFMIPASLCTGTVQMTCTVWDHADATQRPSPLFSRTLTFTDVQPLSLFLVGVSYTAVTPNLVAPTQAAISAALFQLIKTYPVGDFIETGYQTLTWGEVVTGNVGSGSSGFDDLLSKLNDLRGSSPDIYLGVLSAGVVGRQATPSAAMRAPDRAGVRYPWSVLWRAEDQAGPVHAMVSCARELSRELGWLETSSQAAG